MATETKGTGSGGFGRFSKTLAFWLLVILVPVAFLQLSSTRNDAAIKLSYSEYDDQLGAGNVAKVTIVAGDRKSTRLNSSH